MANKKGVLIQQAALVMIFLVLTIPFISSQALALSITKVTVAGSNGIEDVMKSDNDYFTADVQTSEPVVASNLEISYTKKEAFDSCSGTSCTYASSQTDRSGQEMAYTIQLINKSIVVDEVDGTILIDENAPEVTDYTVKKSGDDITISYKISDTACDACAGCGGIDYLSVQQDGAEIEQINVASVCDLSDELDTSVSELNLEDGDHELCMVAVDNVGHESDPSCASVSVDSTGPHFETNSMHIKEAISGNDVQYIGADAVLVDISINVSDSSLNENTVTADFSDLNGVIGDTYANITADACEQSADDETLYICYWSGIYVEDVSGAIKIPFYAQDNGGNEGTYSPTITLTKDDTAPTVVQTYNEVSGEELYFKSGTNSLYADFDATGSAMSYGHAYLTFGLASLSKKDATSCWENGSYWTCVWNFSMSYSGTAASSITIDAEDDAGNAMESYDVDVQTDSTEPEITSMEISLDCPTGSDVLEVMVNATDDSDHLYASFYGENVRTSNDPVTEQCTDLGDGSFNCLLSVNDLVSYPEDENVKIEVKDDAGNVAEDKLSVSVCELEESGTPNLVTLYADENEIGSIDQLTLSYIDYPVYVPMTFSMPSSAHIVSKTASCEAGNAYFIDQSETSSLMVMMLLQQSVPNATMSLRVNCSVSMTMQYGDKVYSNPEIDSVEFSIDLYGTPLGSIGDVISQRIDLQKAGIADAQTNIDTLVTWNTILGIMCKINDLLTKANAVINIVRTIMTTVASIVYGCAHTVPATAACTPVYAAMIAYNVFADNFYSFIVQFIWPPGIFGGIAAVDTGSGLGVIGAIFKTGCIIYSGKLCEGFSGFENKIILNAQEYGQPGYYDANYGGANHVGAQPIQSIQLFTDWDPYKSIHTAQSCLYLDAVIYNTRKERQINCMYTHCLEENAKNGLPTDICDVQFKERQCLYVDGAAWLALHRDWFGHFVELVLNTFFSNLDVLLLSADYYISCWAYDYGLRLNANDFASFYADDVYGLMLMWVGTGCDNTASLLTLTETNWFTSTMDFDFTAPLEGTDYCVGYE